MDGQHSLFARSRGMARGGFAPRRVAVILPAAALALLLSGCDAQRVNELEARVTQVEAKAEAADKRAKAAESLAVQSQPPAISQPEPVPQNDLNPAGDDADAPADDSVSNDAPPPPMADNGKG